MSEDDERAVELSAISAIYPELLVDSENDFAASIELEVSPIKPLNINFTAPSRSAVSLPTPPDSSRGLEDTNNTTVAGNVLDVHSLAHLPPLILQFSLPAAYPSREPPIFKLSTSPSWLPPKIMDTLLADGPRLWKELGHDQVVFTYIDHLQQLAEQGFVSICGGGDTMEVEYQMKIALLDFDGKKKRKLFEQETFDCGICLEPKKGVSCHRLQSCSHVFCIECLQSFYNNCIIEGDVSSVKCLSPDCGMEKARTKLARSGKKRRIPDRTLQPSELLQIPIEQDKVRRYVELKRKAQLESDKTTIYCPRKWCQGAARSKKHPKPSDMLSDDVPGSDSGSEDDESAPWRPGDSYDKMPPPSERLAVCEDCSYAFCSVCEAGWHGEYGVCFARNPSELSAEEKASKDYLERHTSPCPTCDARCQKTQGCNHMLCFRCKTHFCYLCSAWLSADNPYRHFNEAWGGCYMRLWELEGGDEPAAVVRQQPIRALQPQPGPPLGILNADANAPAPAPAVPARHVARMNYLEEQAPDEVEIYEGQLLQLLRQMEDLRDRVLNLELRIDGARDDPQRAAIQDFQVELYNIRRQLVANEGALARADQLLPEAPAPPEAADLPAAVAAVIANAQEAAFVAVAAEEGPQRRLRAARPQRELPARRRAEPQLGGAGIPRRQFPDQGLQRFLDMVERDEEDEWDSDELGDDVDDHFEEFR
ncbi:MAG: translation termination inhibitor protein itt1 [Vezdaea acicularis]|nr:MAG: translation termination inhibitor protein itt1 [Vezdaea acicularis]